MAQSLPVKPTLKPKLPWEAALPNNPIAPVNEANYEMTSVNRGSHLSHRVTVTSRYQKDNLHDLTYFDLVGINFYISKQQRIARDLQSYQNLSEHSIIGLRKQLIDLKCKIKSLLRPSKIH